MNAKVNPIVRVIVSFVILASIVGIAIAYSGSASAQEQTQAQITGITTANYAWHTRPLECDTVPIGGCLVGYQYFGIGDEVLLAAEYSAAVTVTGTPTITLDVGGAEKLATFKEVEGSRLIFGYTVREGDEDHGGLSIPAGSIDLAGGTINGEGGTAASLSHSGLTDQDSHRIDGVRPTFLGIREPAGGSEGSDGVYGIGEDFFFPLKFSEPVYARTGPVDWGRLWPGVRTGPLAPKLRVKVGEKYEYAQPGHLYPHSLGFWYVVKEGDHAPVGFTVEPNSIELNGAHTFRDAAGNPVVSLNHSGISNDPYFLIDGIRPVVTGVSITSSPGNGQSYDEGETISVTVSFTEDMRALPTGGSRTDMGPDCVNFSDLLPQLRIQIGNETRIADLENISGPDVIFSYTVREKDRDPDGISVEKNSIVLPCGVPLRDDVGNMWGENDARREHGAVKNAAGHAVGTTTVGSPSVQVNRAPTVSSAIDDATFVNESGTLQVSLLEVFSDADNDSLTITAASSDDAKATASVASDGSSLTVTVKSKGSAVIIVSADDGNGSMVQEAFTVTVKAVPTVVSAIADVTGLEEGATQDVSLSRGVFDDADGDTLTITAESSDETKATVSVAMNQSDATLKLTLTGVAEGTATINVTVQDSDGNALSDAFDVSVVRAPQLQQANRTPTVSNAIADATVVNESDTKQVPLTGVFDDADNDALTVTAASSDDTKATVSVASDYSRLTVNAQARGTATITVTADDSKGGTVSDSFTVTVKAAPVVASTLADVADLEEDSTQDMPLSGVFSDADGDALTVTATSSDDATATVTVAADQSKLTVEGEAEGTATITVTAQDSDGNRISDTFDVAVTEAPQLQQANRAPTVASAIGDSTIVNESGTREVSLSGVFSDADNDALTITAASSDETKATISVSSDYSSLTVTASARGTATITVTAIDGNGGTVDDSFNVTVKAAPVVSSDLADVTGLEAGATQDVSLVGAFSDADNDTLTITASSSDDAKATVTVSSDGSTLTVAGVAEGTATITVTAQDSDSNWVTDAFEVSVVEIPGPVVNLQLSATSDSVTVSWQAPESGGTPQNYIVHLKKEGGKKGSGKTKRPKAKKTSVTFKNLDAGQTYKVWVRAQNETGKGERAHATITLPEEGQSQG